MDDVPLNSSRCQDLEEPFFSDAGMPGRTATFTSLGSPEPSQHNYSLAEEWASAFFLSELEELISRSHLLQAPEISEPWTHSTAPSKWALHVLYLQAYLMESNKISFSLGHHKTHSVLCPEYQYGCAQDDDRCCSMDAYGAPRASKQRQFSIIVKSGWLLSGVKFYFAISGLDPNTLQKPN